jgi:peptidoglycan/LPS O-acetylase OafA/YrhL
LYLWHLPIFKIFSFHSTLPPWVSFISKFIVSFAVAFISWYVLEKNATGLGHKLSKRIKEKESAR